VKIESFESFFVLNLRPENVEEMARVA